MERKRYDEYIRLLHEELIPAMGCTEPIALALAGAKGRELEALPERVVVKASGSIIKNTKSVVSQCLMKFLRWITGIRLCRDL